MTTEATPIVRWVFQRDRETLTCGVDFTSQRSYEVCVVPHHDVNATVIESFDSSLSALKRHADIALRLREAGWSVMDRVAA